LVPQAADCVFGVQVHCPLEHDVLPVHLFEQVPQLELSVAAFTHAVPHKVVGGVAAGHAHLPLWQLATAGHAFPLQRRPRRDPPSGAIVIHCAV
jgi:hypothetical protein